MVTVTAVKLDRGLGRIRLAVVALFRCALTAIDRRYGARAEARFGGMRHRPRRHSEGEKDTDNDG